jgi:hypothetical protein
LFLNSLTESIVIHANFFALISITTVCVLLCCADWYIIKRFYCSLFNVCLTTAISEVIIKSIALSLFVSCWLSQCCWFSMSIWFFDSFVCFYTVDIDHWLVVWNCTRFIWIDKEFLYGFPSNSVFTLSFQKNLIQGPMLCYEALNHL